MLHSILYSSTHQTVLSKSRLFVTIILCLLLSSQLSAQLEVSHTSTAVNCAGLSNGTCNLDISGGCPPYSLTWFPLGTIDGTEDGTFFQAGLSAGQHSCLISDTCGNDIFYDFFIEEPEILIALFTSASHNDCFSECSGTANLVVTGGTPPYYTYDTTHDNIIEEVPNGNLTYTNLCPGTISVRVVDSNECISAASAHLEAENPGTQSLANFQVSLACGGSEDSLVYSFDYPASAIGETFEIWFKGQLVDQQTIEAGQTEWTTFFAEEQFDDWNTIGIRLSSDDECAFLDDDFNLQSCCELDLATVTTACSGGQAYVQVTFDGSQNPNESFSYDLDGQIGTGLFSAGGFTIDVPGPGYYPLTIAQVGNTNCGTAVSVFVNDCSTNCWDLNGNSICDGGEDFNGDWFCSQLDCDIASCLDLNNNGQCDPEEDFNQDGTCNLTDCQFTPDDPSDFEYGVWPGDANYDGVANNLDLITIALAFDFSGAPRTDASNSWIEQEAEDWAFDFTDGTNLKHSDCNGNGVVSFGDKNALEANYNSTHGKTEGEEGTLGEAPLYVAFPDETLTPGQELSLPIVFGTDANTVESVYGMAFSLDYSGAMIESANISFDSSWIGEDNVDAISLIKHFPEEQRFELAFSRTTHIAIGGFGTIGTLQGILIENVEAYQPGQLSQLSVNISNVHVVDNLSQEVLFDLVEETGSIALGQETLNNELSIFPTVVSNQLTVVDQGSNNLSYLRIIDINGKVIFSEALSDQKTHNIKLPRFNNGLYFLELGNSSFRDVRKIRVAH